MADQQQPTTSEQQAPAPAPTTEEPQQEEKPKPKIEANKDLWHNISINVKDATDQGDQTVVFVGARNCGKTSLIYRLIGLASNPKPTIALEYCFGKREERNVVQIAHFWELAQGIELPQLAEVVITPENVHTVVAVCVVDCCDINAAWETATFWLKRLDSRVQEIFEKMRSKGSATPDRMLTRAKRRIGDDHPDLDTLRVSGVPTVLVCNRMDAMKEDTVKAKLFARSMRFLAHLYGASLIFTSQTNENSHVFKALLNSVIYQTPLDIPAQFDIEKGSVLVPCGRDSRRDIGDPDPRVPQGFKASGDNELDRWKAPFDEAFPPKNIGGKDASVDDQFQASLYDTSEKGYGESSIDGLRKQKDTELVEYRKAASKKASEKKSANANAE